MECKKFLSGQTELCDTCTYSFKPYILQPDSWVKLAYGMDNPGFTPPLECC